MKYKYFLLCLGLMAVACDRLPETIYDEGVSLELAQFRAANYSKPVYALSFNLPDDPGQPVEATAAITFETGGRTPVILDFTGDADAVYEVAVNEREVEYELRNQHIIIAKKHVRKGTNTVAVKFRAGDRSLNRRDEFLYTLLVPDRARTLFPCFDQPDLKAKFTLSLEVPEEWETIGNGSVSGTGNAGPGRKLVKFNMTEPIPTYLFSFVAGVFDKVMETRDGREISIYHRETDPAKIAQCGTIFDEVYHSLEWLEEYTAVPYPFEKYDLVILPGFQYGGMEHMGATLYNDSRMFVERNATVNDLLARSSLIAHETAHMWFGDYVTMRWFNDVWNKEVFANWFAGRIVEPMYPDVNHDLNFILSNYPSAYSEDRTGGAMPIQQHLPNLRDAGLIYSNIVYTKSPIVMDMLVRKVGEGPFREAIREYLNTYAYGNADWDGLVEILDKQTGEDLRAWSDVWVKERGMPTIGIVGEGEGEDFTVRETDPWGRDGIRWGQDISHAGIDGHVIPNSDGRGYGYFVMDAGTVEWALDHWMTIEDDVTRLAVLMNLYEGVLNRAVDPVRFVGSVSTALAVERNTQIYTQMLAYAEQCANLFLQDACNFQALANFQAALLKIGDLQSPSLSTPAMKSFFRMASTQNSIGELYDIWLCESRASKYSLSERDITSISYELAVRMPEQADRIVATQLARITNPDRRKEYEFISQAVSPSQQKRDAFFESLLLAGNRGVEPWVVSAMRLFNHPARQQESLKYIRPALDALQDVQRTGDIFLPANWCAALFGGHTSPEALEIMERFFADNPGYPELLAGKIRLRADHLYIANDRLAGRYTVK